MCPQNLLSHSDASDPHPLQQRIHELEDSLRQANLALEQATHQFEAEQTERRQTERQLRRLSRAVEQSPISIMITDTNGTIEYVNPRFSQVSGFSAQEALGQTPRILNSGFHSREFYTQMWNALLAGEEYFTEILNRHKDGNLFWERALLSPIFDEDGQIVSFVAIKEEITQQKLLNEQLNRHVHQLNSIMQTMPEGLVLLNPLYQILSINPAATEHLAVLGVTDTDKPLRHLDHVPIQQYLVDASEHTMPHAVRSQGRVFEVSLHTIASAEKPEGWLLVVRDVSQERRIQEQVQHQDRLAAVGQLAAGIAHDFNNVMATIVLYSDMLRGSTSLHAHELKWLEVIRHQARHATNLIQQILDFSRRSDAERSITNFLPFVKENVKLWERILPENIQIRLHYDRNEYIIRGNLTRLQQALMNLAVNARDAMPNGGELTLTLKHLHVAQWQLPPILGMGTGDWVALTITDNGVGIPETVLPHIFEPFFTTKPHGQGTGLGLAQVYGIIQQHDGFIDVTSSVRLGTTFNIYLPMDVGVDEPSTAHDGMPVLPAGKGLILVVEDDLHIRQAVCDLLESLGYQVLSAQNGRHALDTYGDQLEKIDLVLTDVVMPEMGGWDLFQHLQQFRADLKVLFLTRYPLNETSQAAIEQGTAAYLKKPVQAEVLANTVAMLIHTHD
ncbi:MAG: hypothetical protein OHK0023_18650 [Anaerolineae bacterium]